MEKNQTPQSLESLYPQLAKDREVEDCLKKTFGEDTPKILEKMIAGTLTTEEDMIRKNHRATNRAIERVKTRILGHFTTFPTFPSRKAKAAQLLEVERLSLVAGVGFECD